VKSSPSKVPSQTGPKYDSFSARRNLGPHTHAISHAGQNSWIIHVLNREPNEDLSKLFIRALRVLATWAPKKH
jgi:hypothetical protein